MIDVEQHLRRYSETFAKLSSSYLPQEEDRISEAMRYSYEGGGKRIRPALVSAFCSLWGTDAHYGEPLAVALEMVHTYSLIHDDLPCMDDDAFRRGRLSCHQKFGEAAALLAGDALLTLAFETIATAAKYPSELRCKAVALLAKAAGVQGMIGGQWLDLMYENRMMTRQALEEMNARKTGALLGVACEFGCLAGGADSLQTAAALQYANAIGLLFQLTDDLLDATGTQEITGKTSGKDQAAGKCTWVSLLDLDGARAAAQRLVEKAQQALRPYADVEQMLYCLPEWLAVRQY